MAEPHMRKEIRFPNEPGDIFQLRMIGYNDFRYLTGWDYFRVYSWTSLHYVVGGRGKLFIRGNEYDIGEGSFFLIPPEEPIMYYPSEDDPWRYYWINFNVTSVFNLGERIGLNANTPVRTAKQQAETLALFEELFSEDAASLPLYYKALSAIMSILSFEAVSASSVPNPPLPKETLVTEAKQLIKLNSSRPDFTVSDIPKMLFVSQRHLGKLFKEQTGMTPVAYLSEVRLNHASELLHKQNYSVSELCRAVGFGDELYFMKRFKKKFKITVREYRKQVLLLSSDRTNKTK